MSGIYIHIPFCKQACHYCNFHFSTSLKYKADMVRALLKELDLRKDYLGAEPLETIYFGGGTPSLLDQRELDLFFDKLASNFPVSDFQLLEITLEANPDDLNPKKIMELKNTPVNRLSIGVQSFFEKDLQFMNRAHHAGEAEACIKNAQNAGFENLTIDLIYGSPTTPDQNWEKNIEKAVYLNIPHISCYCLTVEPKTALAHFIKKRKVSPPDEEQAARQFDILINKLNKENYAHYEISNFAKKGFYSKHNTNYWKGKKYLGIGPSAHSFDSRSRQWNVAHNIKYMQALNQNRPDIGIEILTPQQQYNEYVMTSLRTMWGINFFKIKNMGQDIYFLKKIKPCLEEGLVFEKDAHFILTRKGKFLADGIAARLFL